VWWRSPGRPWIDYPVLVAVLVLLIIAGGVLRGLAIGGNDRVSTDDRGNGANANAILTHARYVVFRWAPGTPFVFAVATRLTGEGRVRAQPYARGAAQYANLVFEIGTLVLIAVVGWMLAGPYAALLAVALAALYLPLIFATRTFLSEPVGGLMILATFAAAAFARRRGIVWLVGAGVLAGLACLVREDLFPGAVVIAVALGLSARGGGSPRRLAVLRGGVYLAAATVVLLPWIVYASSRDKEFVPVTDGGPTAAFIGTYLPGHGELQYVLQAFKGPVCRRYPQYCRDYRLYGSGPMFELVASRYPGLSQTAAVRQAVLDNLRRYALGQPLAFAGMLLHKLWIMWGYPWGGGNGKPDTNRVEHLIFVGLAWLGLLGGAAVTRRWSLVTVAAGLVVITALNVFVNAQGRDNVRLVPLLFAFGLAGFWLLAERAWKAVSLRRSGRRHAAARA
jgi:4-amino-4-deoxy-L-arabinose transferase-like glycosyltransferase